MVGNRPVSTVPSSRSVAMESRNSPKAMDLESILSPEAFEAIRKSLNETYPTRIRAIHYVAPHQHGKSTLFVPSLWNYIQKEWPDVCGTFIKGTLAQVVHLETVYSSENTVLCVNKDANLSGEKSERLYLTHYAVFYRNLVAALDGMKKQQRPMPSLPLVFFLDLERFPTLAGEVTLGLFLTYLSKLSTDTRAVDCQLDITVITLAAHPVPDVYRVFREYLHVDSPPVLNHTVRKRPQREQCDTVALQELLLQELAKPIVPPLDEEEPQESEREAGSRFLLIMPKDLYYHHLSEPWSGTSSPLPVVHITDASKPKELEEIMGSRHKIIRVDHSFQTVLPLDTTHVITTGKKWTRIYDKRTSQFISSYVDLTPEERAWEDAWVQASGRDITIMEWQDPPSDAVPQTGQSPLEGDMMFLVYQMVTQWETILRSRIPIPSLSHIKPAYLTEVARRLATVGLIRPDPDVLEQWSRVPKYDIYYKQMLPPMNSRSNFQLACLISHIKADKEEPRRNQLNSNAKRVLVRLAAIINFGVANLIQLDFAAFERLGLTEPGRTNIFEALIARDTAGVGRDLLRCGALWVALGLWQKRLSVRGQFWKLADDGFISLACSTIKLSKPISESVLAYVLYLEDLFRLPPIEPDQELAETALDPSDVIKINVILLQCYMHQQVCFMDGPMPLDMVSNSAVNMESDLHYLLDTKAISDHQRANTGGRIGFTAIYTSATKLNGKLHPYDLTLIPNQCHASLRAILKEQKCCEILISACINR